MPERKYCFYYSILLGSEESITVRKCILDFNFVYTNFYFELHVKEINLETRFRDFLYFIYHPTSSQLPKGGL